MGEEADWAEVKTELEVLVREYRQIGNMISVFASGVEQILGTDAVTGGMFAIEAAMEAENEKFGELFQKILQEPEI